MLKKAVKKKSVKPYVIRDGYALVLRTSNPDGTSYNGFKWPESGIVKCPDWSPEKVCGQGLHGLLWGLGDQGLLSPNEEKLWQVVEVKLSEVIDLGSKVKFPSCRILVSDLDHSVATGYIMACKPGALPRITATAGDSGTATAGYSGTATAGDSGTATAGDSGTATAGYSGTATAGDSGTATAGYSGTATAGYSGTATAGYSGTATAGYSGTATAGDSGTATAGYSGTATAGYSGTATAGYSGTATAGDRGTATAGYSGTATAGDRGTATAGDRGTATAGEDGVLTITWHDGTKYRRAIAVVGLNGIKPKTPYHIENGVFIEGVQP